MHPDAKTCDETILAHIREMAQNGITLSRAQSKILMRDYGIDIPPHLLTEYKYRKRHER